jgi:hypothetical protein
MARFRKFAAFVAAASLFATIGMLVDESPASATKVSNPSPATPFTLRFASGTLNIGDNGFDFVDEGRQPQCSDGENNDGSGADAQDANIDYPADTQCTSAADDSETQPGFQPKEPIQLNNGTIDAAGNVVFPQAGVFFPTQYMFVNADDASGGIVDDFIVVLKITALSNWTGTINPMTGAMSIDMHVKVSATGGPLSSNCAVTPIDINGMTTGTSAGPGPKPALTGAPLNQTDGRLTMVNTSYSVPGASNCGTVAFVYNLNNAINDALGLPSGAGNNDATFTGIFTPNIPRPGVVASFAATPSSGPAPLAVSFNASASTATGTKTYAWDLDGNGSFDAGVTSATPSTTYNTTGVRTVKLRVTDPQGDFAETTQLVTVGSNAPPIANDQTVSTPEDTAKNVTVTATDPEGGAVTYARTTPNPAHGAATCNTAGACSYTPALNYNGPDSFGFVATDGFGNTDTGVVTVNVTPVNDAPTSANVVKTIVEDTPGTVTFSGTDLDGDALTYNVLSSPTKGVLSGSGSSRLYTPNANAIGADSFTYDVNDGSGAHSNVSTASINITPVNDAPVANDGTATTNEDTPVGITLTGSDLDGDGITYGLLALPAHGTITGSGANLTYTPAANFNGTDQLTFKVTDPSGATDSAVIDITVNPTNDGPTATNQSVGTNEGTPVDITIVANDVDGDALTYTPTTPTANGGTISCAAEVCTYTPPSGFSGTDSFTVLVEDPSAASATSTVTVSVSALNNTAPQINDGSVAVLEDTLRAFSLLSADADGDPRTYSVQTYPAAGSLTCSSSGACTYLPPANFAGSQTFVVQVNDGRGGIDNATITLAVANLNDAPVVAPGQTLVTAEDTVGSVSVASTDADGDSPTWSVKRDPLKGSLACTSAAVCTFTPNANANGGDSFDIEVDDGHGARVRVTIPISITPVDDPATAGTVNQLVAEDSGATSFALLGGDPDGGGATFEAQPATSGTLSCGSGGTCTFTPAANAVGTETVSYTVTDSGGSATGTIVLTITPANDAPVAPGLTLSTNEDTPVAFTLPASDADVGDPLTFTRTSNPVMGTVAGSGANLTYTPAANASGTVTFGYAVRDAAGATANGTVTITVLPVNDLPVASSGAVATAEDTPKAIALTGSDAEGPVTVTVSTPPAHGTYASGTYTPALNYYGSDSIGFTVKDATNQTATGVMLITITPVNDAPVASDLTVVTSRTAPVPVTFGYTDPDGLGSVTFAIVTPPTKGTLSGTAPNLTYTPNGFTTGAEVFTYKVTDSGGLTDSGTVNMTILQGSALPTSQVAAPVVVTKPSGILGSLQQYTYTNLSSTLKTSGSNLPVSGVVISFTVDGKVICSATTNSSGVATCTGKGARKDVPTYTASFAGNAGFLASTATGTLS